MTRFATARALALAVPLALMAGALGSQYLGGLYPCEMCHWQRWPHYTAIVIAALAFVVPGRMVQGTLVIIAALAIATSGAIGGFHAGVEYGWWEGITGCTAAIGQGGDIFAEIMAAPIIRCDVAPWSFAGISLAGYNAILSLGGAIAILALMLGRSGRLA